MTKHRPKRDDTHPDDVWRPGEHARVKRRLFNLFRQSWTPEMHEEYRARREAEQAQAKAPRDRKRPLP